MKVGGDELRRHFEGYLEVCRARRSIGAVPADAQEEYDRSKAQARESIFTLLRATRNLLDVADLPSPPLRGLVEVRTAEDLTNLALDRRAPIEMIAELLQKLEERHNDREPVAIFIVDDDAGALGP